VVRKLSDSPCSLFDRFLAIHNKSNQIIAIYKEMLPRQLLHFLRADDNPGKRKIIMLRFGVMMFWLPKYENLSSFFLPPRKSWIRHQLPKDISAPVATFDLSQTSVKLMNLEELVKFLKYETDLNRFFDSTAGYYFQNQVLPSQTEAQRIKIVLAISDHLRKESGEKERTFPS